MTKTLQDFINDYDRWLQGEWSPLFVRDSGSCMSLLIWCAHHRMESSKLRLELNSMMSKDGMRPHVPFNDSIEEYFYECERRNIKRNARRIAWYRSHAK